MPSSSAAGPIEVRFLLANGRPGMSEPLVATGHANAGVVVSVTVVDSHRATINADVWGTLFKSEPIEIDYSQLHTLVVSDSALYPVGNLTAAALPAEEADRLRHQLRIELDGSVAIEANCYAFEAAPAEIYVGSAPFGSTSGAKFTGEFIDSRRIPIPRLSAMPWGARARLDVRFPSDRIGSTESLLTVDSEMGMLSYSVAYVGSGKLRFIASGPDGHVRQSAEVETDLSAPHTMRFSPCEPTSSKEAFDLSCDFDGRRILRGARNLGFSLFIRNWRWGLIFSRRSTASFAFPGRNLA